MKKTIFIIIVLLGLIGGLGYYGYTTIISGGTLTQEDVDQALAEIDQATDDIQNQGVSEDTITDINSMLDGAVATTYTPATTVDIDAIIAELDSFGTSNTSGFSTSLADL